MCAVRHRCDDTFNEEFEIAANVPNLSNCDAEVGETLDLYWVEKGGYWHFFRTSVLEKLKPYDGGSKVLQRHFNNKNNLPFLCNDQ